jgi:hypothetical protein
MARRYGLYPTARSLHLDHTRLRKLVQAASGAPKAAELPAFLELMAPPATHISELEGDGSAL